VIDRKEGRIPQILNTFQEGRNGQDGPWHTS
jgi:hypothetical protein